MHTSKYIMMPRSGKGTKSKDNVEITAKKKNPHILALKKVSLFYMK